jgi:transposase-like protein
MPDNPRPEALTAKQERALDHLLAGETITAAAKAVNADPSTLHRWLREDPHFQATYNQRCRELREAHQIKLATIAEKALQTVEQAVENGDVGTSMKSLSGLGLLSGKAPQIGPDDPRDIELDHRSREDRRHSRESMAEVQAYLASTYEDTIKPLMELTKMK